MKRIFLLFLCLPLMAQAQTWVTGDVQVSVSGEPAWNFYSCSPLATPQRYTATMPVGNTSLPAAALSEPFAASRAPLRAPGAHTGGTTIDTPGLILDDALLPLLLIALVYIAITSYNLYLKSKKKQ